MDLRQTKAICLRVNNILRGLGSEANGDGSFVVFGVDRFDINKALNTLPHITPRAVYSVGPSVPDRRNMDLLEDMTSECAARGKKFLWVSSKSPQGGYTDVTYIWDPKNKIVVGRIETHNSIYAMLWWQLTNWRTRFADWQDRRIKKRLGLR